MANVKGRLAAMRSPEGAICETPQETAALGAEFAGSLTKGAVVSLEGGLGAGKTQFVKGLAQGLACPDAALSPSFALVHEYQGGRLPLLHFDFYRLRSAAELENAGYHESLSEGILAVEWGDKFPEALPEGTFHLEFRILPGGARCIRERSSGHDSRH